MYFRYSFYKKILIVFLFTVFASPIDALAQGLPTIIDSIRIEGNQRIESETIISYLSVVPGDQLRPELIDESIKSLFSTGLFSDVSISKENTALIVRVFENPLINRVAFEGNFSVNDEILSNEVQLKPRGIFTRTRVQGDVQRLIQIYQSSGRFAVTVEPKVIQLEQNRVDLVYEINEGPLTGVRKIRFIGNEIYTDRQLRGAIQTKETRWWRWLTSDDTYDPDRVGFDRELLSSYYMARGYADFIVVSSVAQLSPDGKDFYITFTVEEGSRYKFGQSVIKSDVEEIDIDYLTSFVRGKVGSNYDASQVEDTVLNLTFELGKAGYAFVDIRPLLERNRESGVIDIIYQISQGPRVYVNRINITGNSRTLDRVIRREFKIAEGDAFNSAKVQKSIQNIHSLGFFDQVDLSQTSARTSSLRSAETISNSPTDRVDLNLDVRERSTGDLVFGVGYSTVDALISEITLNERNLLGRGQNLSLSFTLASKRQQFDISLTEPYFLGRTLSAGVDLFSIRNDLQSTSSYTQNRRGFGLRSGFPLTTNLFAGVRYSLRQDIIEDVGVAASTVISNQRGSRIVSTVGYSFSYDLRDDRFFPTEGYSLQFNQELAGLGGNVNYLRTSASGQFHFSPFRRNVVFSLTFEEGFIHGLGDNVAITDRFFIGGDDFRGFASSGIGPRDKITNDSLGGRLYYITTAEVGFPVGLPEDLGVRGKLFIDVGSLGLHSSSSADVYANGGVRASYGFGINWMSPLGPLRLDWAWPLKSESYDRLEEFRFSIGTRF